MKKSDAIANLSQPSYFIDEKGVLFAETPATRIGKNAIFQSLVALEIPAYEHPNNCFSLSVIPTEEFTDTGVSKKSVGELMMDNKGPVTLMVAGIASILAKEGVHHPIFDRYCKENRVLQKSAARRAA